MWTLPARLRTVGGGGRAVAVQGRGPGRERRERDPPGGRTKSTERAWSTAAPTQGERNRQFQEMRSTEATRILSYSGEARSFR